MVMHARKQPRLDDGYMEKRDAHPFQSSQYPSKNYGLDNYADRYKRDGGSSDRCRDNSPASRLSPRYHNKSSYSEKIKERYEKGSSSFPDRKANHSYSNQRSNSQNGNYDKGVKNSRDVKEKEGKSESQKTPGRTCGEWSEHVSSSGMHYYYNCKSEVSQWEKPKDWTDGPGSKPDSKPNNYARSGGNISSSSCGGGGGNSSGAKVNYPNKSAMDKSKHSSNAADRTLLSEKNLKRSMSDINQTYPHSGKPDKKYIIEKFQASQHLAVEQQHLRGASQSSSLSSSHYRTPHSLEHKFDNVTNFHRKDGSGTYPDPQGSQANRRYRRNSEGNRSYGGGGGHVTPRKHNHDSQIDDMDISPGSSPSSSRRSSCAGTPQLGPSSTPMSLPPSTAAALAGIAPTGATSPLLSTIPCLISKLSGSHRNQDLTHKALQTLQRLQEVISRQIAQQTSPGNPPQQSPRPTSDVPTSQTAHQQQAHHKPHQHPHHHQPHPSPTLHNSNMLLSPQGLHSHHPNPHPHPHSHPQPDNNSQHHHHLHPAGHREPPHTPGGHSSSSVYGKLNQISRHDEDHHMTGPGGGESPLSETSQGPSCLSPGSSTTSSQTAAVAHAELSAAGITKETSMGINPALKNYYNEKLIGHVLGWQAEHAERQAKKYRQENLTIDCMRCSQVSVELKRARSLVRIAEIQSTLHEQRILFLAQQIHELENMKPPSFSSSHSFTSSSHS
ncbi:WW domain-containing adapter protein with coiled-coil-like isoform X1 [Mizuhopecten yessoensis]|uniref:WW domain-containing adapter protein with coiled-coil-like isoform X1 n=1 Tax=Mizuhopecten yessoensis TaxID=6573 RepID=UPI000B459B1D|nr:WW domain-containing adapter protein with coiled-coil-like isoform X1 [Mizuhopecten yessoensis]